ncbi:unnamed protein product, partial [Ranitomeya imitator]
MVEDDQIWTQIIDHLHLPGKQKKCTGHGPYPAPASYISSVPAQSWFDEFLTWDPENFDNVTKISIPTQWVWKPDIVVTEQVDEVKSSDETFVYLDYTGRVYNNKPMLIKSSCKVNLYYFPFDHQNCCLTFSSWTHTIQDMDLSFWRHTNDTRSFTSNYKKNGEWDILEVIPSHVVLTEEDDNHKFGLVLFSYMDNDDSRIHGRLCPSLTGRGNLYDIIIAMATIMTSSSLCPLLIGQGLAASTNQTRDVYVLYDIIVAIVIRREPLFYAVNLILPSMLLMIMNIAGFYLPPETGERTSYKITLLLGYSVFLLIVSDNCPPTGTPLIGSYFVMCMVLLVISVMESIFIARVVHQDTLHRSVPQWVKTMVLEKMAALVCVKSKDYFAISRNNISDISEQKEDSNSTEKLSIYNDETIKYHIRQLATAQDLDAQLMIIKEIQESLKKNTDSANIFRSALQIIEGTCTDNKHYIITEIQFKTDTRRSEGPAQLTDYGEKGRHERWMVTIALVIRTSYS